MFNLPYYILSKPTDCIDAQSNMTDVSCWKTILDDSQMSYIWQKQYFNNSEIFMESPQDVTHTGNCISQIKSTSWFLAAKYAPCRFCDVVSLEHARSDLKLIQQTPADPASITINQPVFDHLNLDLKRLTDNCGLEKVDLPGNQFNKATQVILPIWQEKNADRYI